MDRFRSERGSMLDAALALAGEGFAVFPIIPRDKRPAVDGGCRAATRDAKQIRWWWAQRPLCGIGLATGTISGVFVVDVDERHRGFDSMRALVAQHGRLPWTLRSRTPGGVHLVYRLPAVPIRQGANVLGPGIDTRAAGGYVVAPPSIHPSGARYAWQAPRVEPAEAPPWIIALAAKPAPPAPPPTPLRPVEPDIVDRARAYLEKCEPAISGQGGHGRCFWAAIAMVRGFALDAGTALALLENVYNPRCQPRWSRRELEHKIASAMTRSSHAFGFLRDEPRRCA